MRHPCSAATSAANNLPCRAQAALRAQPARAIPTSSKALVLFPPYTERGTNLSLLVLALCLGQRPLQLLKPALLQRLLRLARLEDVCSMCGCVCACSSLTMSAGRPMFGAASSGMDGPTRSARRWHAMLCPAGASERGRWHGWLAARNFFPQLLYPPLSTCAIHHRCGLCGHTE